MSDFSTLRPSGWLHALLERHGLKVPDGRPLFQYRVTDSEFETLRDILQISSNVMQRTIRSHGYLDALLAIYSAEWWRRNFSGGSWKWDGVLKDIGYDQLSLTQQARSELIQSGLEKWNREVKVLNGHRRFLGSVAIEGGVPLSQLSDSGSWIERVLKPVLDKHLRRNLPIIQLVDEYESIIPKTFRSDAFKQILVDIVETVSSLKEKIPLSNDSNPVAFLDKNTPNWRDSFPIPLDSFQGNLLITTLIRTASESLRKNVLTSAPFQFERFLKTTRIDEQSIFATLTLPRMVPVDEIYADSLDLNTVSSFEFELHSSSNKSYKLGRAVKTHFSGKPVYKIFGKTFSVEGRDALDEYELYIKLPDQSKHNLKLENATLVDTHSPWFFAKENSNYKLIIHGGSFSTKQEKAIIYLPKPGQYQLISANDFDRLGEDFDGSYYKFSGHITFQDSAGLYVFKTGQEESEFTYELMGKKLEYAKVPSIVFLGSPKVFKRNSSTGQIERLPDLTLKAKPVGEPDHPWVSAQLVKDGYYHIRLQDVDGSILLNKRIGLLHNDFKVLMFPDSQDVCKGEIEFSSMNSANIQFPDSDINFDISENSQDCHVATVSCTKQPPFSVNANLSFEHRNRPLMIEVPFPSKGALLFDSQNRIVSSHEPLYVSNLFGYRVKLFNSLQSLNKIKVLLSLKDPHMSFLESNQLIIERTMNVNGKLIEVSLIDWIEDIKSLLSVSNSIDSEVNLSLVASSTTLFEVHLKHYQIALKPVKNEGIVELESEIDLNFDQFNQLRFKANSLTHPNKEAIELEQIKSSGIPLPAWYISKALPLSDDAWIISAEENALFKVRPLLWEIPSIEPESENFSSNNNSSGLSHAISLSNRAIRQHAIAYCLTAMTEDLLHSDWQFLGEFWTAFKHLPLNSFDLWRAMSCHTKFMSILFIKGNFPHLIERLTSEMGVAWELITLDEWQQSFESWKKQLLIDIDNNALVKSILANKIKKMVDVSSYLEMASEILESKMVHPKPILINTPEVALKGFLADEQEKLKQRNAERNYPENLEDLIEEYAQENLTHDSADLVSISNPHHNSVIYLPLILAHSFVNHKNSGWSLSQVEIFQLNQMKTFDDEWFRESFKWLTLLFYQKLTLKD
jgi:hypothetical protein